VFCDACRRGQRGDGVARPAATEERGLAGRCRANRREDPKFATESRVSSVGCRRSACFRSLVKVCFSEVRSGSDLRFN